MTDNEYSSRRVFKSSITSQNVIKELLQMYFLSELLNPSEEIWLVSPWVSDIVLLDNRSGRFDAINPDWRGREIRLSDLTVNLLSRGSRLIIVTRSDVHNRKFLTKLKTFARESAVDDGLKVVVNDNLHTKGILGDNSVLLGSMNITYNGMEINDEYLEYDTDRSNIASARLAFGLYLEEVNG